MFCTTSSHSSAPGGAFQNLLSLPHKCPILALTSWKRGLEMKNLPGPSNSSQPLLLHRSLLRAHFSREKRLRNPFLSCPCCSHCSCLVPRALPELCPGSQGKGCLHRTPGPAPIKEWNSTQGKLQQWDQTQLNKQPRSISHRKSGKFLLFSTGKRNCLTTWRKETSAEQSPA